jgi:aminoglycoside 6'-N-acetyltransferase I
VDGDVRRLSIGAGLMQAAERRARAAGYDELASGAALANGASHRAHAAVGFDEVERAVHFRKALRAGGSGPERTKRTKRARRQRS